MEGGTDAPAVGDHRAQAASGRGEAPESAQDQGKESSRRRGQGDILNI